MKRPNRITSQQRLVILPLFFLLLLLSVLSWQTGFTISSASNPVSIYSHCGQNPSGSTSSSSASCNLSAQVGDTLLIIIYGTCEGTSSPPACSISNPTFSGSGLTSVLSASSPVVFGSPSYFISITSVFCAVSSSTSNSISDTVTGVSGQNVFSAILNYDLENTNCQSFIQSSNSNSATGGSPSADISYNTYVNTSVATQSASFAISSNSPNAYCTGYTFTNPQWTYDTSFTQTFYGLSTLNNANPTVEFSVAGNGGLSAACAIQSVDAVVTFLSSGSQQVSSVTTVTSTQTDTAFNTPSPSSTAFWLIPFLFLMMPTLIFLGAGLLGRVNGSGLLFLALIGLNSGAIFGILAQIMPFGVLILTAAAFLIILWKGR